MNPLETEFVSTSIEDTPPQISWPRTNGRGWTGVTLSSFDLLFTKLPAEIRVKVWTFCVFDSEPRVIELKPNTRCCQIVTQTKTPGFIQACRESRFEGLKVYEPLGSDPRHSYAYSRSAGWRATTEQPRIAPIWINFEIDTIFFGAELFAHREAIALVVKGMQIKHEKVQKLGIHFWGCRVENYRLNVVSKCSALRKLFVVCGKFPSWRKFPQLNSELDWNRLCWKKQLGNVLIAGQYCFDIDFRRRGEEESDCLTTWIPDELCHTGEYQLRRYAYVHGSFEYGDQVDSRPDYSYSEDDFGGGIDSENPSVGGVSFKDQDDKREEEEEEEGISGGGLHILDISASLERLQVARMKVETAKEDIWDTQRGIGSYEEYDESKKLVVEGDRRPQKHLKKNEAAMEMLKKDNSTARSILKEARQDFENEKYKLYDTWRDAKIHFLRYAQVEMYQEKLEQILRTKAFVDRYVHHGLRYVRRPTGRGPRPKKEPKRHSNETELLSRGPNVREFVKDAQGETYHTRKNHFKKDGRAKRQIMSRRGLGQRFTSREGYLGSDFDRVDVFAPGRVKRVIPKHERSKLKGAIVTRKARPALVDDGMGKPPSDRRSARGYMREGLKEGLIFRAQKEGWIPIYT